jgi:hypothetical protein
MISAEVHRNYFHSSIELGATVLYPLHVVTPLMNEEFRMQMVEFSAAGFAGATGSCDGTHIAIKKCSYRICNNHLGQNEHLTTWLFNLTVNHCCCILSTTIDFPGWWNDKTIVLFDSIVKGIYEGM